MRVLNFLYNYLLCLGFLQHHTILQQWVIMPVILSLGFFCLFVFKVQLGILSAWKKKSAPHSVSKSYFTTCWAENYQGQASVSFKGNNMDSNCRNHLRLNAGMFLLKDKPFVKQRRKCTTLDIAYFCHQNNPCNPTQNWDWKILFK